MARSASRLATSRSKAYGLFLVFSLASIVLALSSGRLLQPVAAAVSNRSRPALFKSSASEHSKGAQFLQQVLSNPRKPASNSPSGQVSSESICRPTGQIEDASCDYETVETINSQFFDRLDALRQTDFFKYYKVNLFKECPFWNENGFCMNRACGVETEEEKDIPEEYRAKKLGSVTTASIDDVVQTGSDSSCSCSSTEFCHVDDQDTEEGVYVDLLKNPERFTGYAGSSANRVWKSIYEENCFNGVKFIEPARTVASGGTGFIDKNMLFQGNVLASSGNGASPANSLGLSTLMTSLQAPLDSGDSEQCLEKRVFYRIISGLHASISIHICHDFLDTKTGEWAPNLECFISRIAEHPERLQNVYFDYVLLLRALSRLGDSSENFSLRHGDTIEDSLAVSQLDDVIRDARACPTTFDEAKMFSGQSRESLELKQEFRQHFRNVSSIMDCVGCDKCRLWGKLQINGLGTALKLLFNGNEEGAERKAVQLQRSELVALVNAAHRIAESLRAVEIFRDMYHAQKNQVAAAPESAAPPVASSSTKTTHREQHHDERTPPSRGTERLRAHTQQQQNQSPVFTQSIDTPVTGSLSSLPFLQHLAHWIAAHVRHSLDSCRRSLGQCLHLLGVHSSAANSALSTSSASHSEL